MYIFFKKIILISQIMSVNSEIIISGIIAHGTWQPDNKTVICLVTFTKQKGNTIYYYLIIKFMQS